MLLITMQATCRPRLGWGGGVVQPLPLSHAAEFGTPPSRRPIFMRLGSGLQSKRPELRIRTASAKSPADSSHLTAGRHGRAPDMAPMVEGGETLTYLHGGGEGGGGEEGQFPRSVLQKKI